MKPMRAGGMTLIEMLIAVAMVSIAMTVSVSVLTTGVNVARKGEQFVSSNEASRLAMEFLLRDLRAAGMGAPGGLIVTEPGGIPVTINPLFTEAGPNGTDMLWMVVPRWNVMASNCSKKGSGVPLATSGTGTLKVVCTTPALTVGDTLMVSNFTTAALISGTTFPTATTIAYAESNASFSNSPSKGAFQRGDVAFPVDIVRYSIEVSAVTGRPELLRHVGTLNSPVSAAQPFRVVAGAAMMRSIDIEDLQVAFGSGSAPNLNFVSGHAPGFNGVPTQSVRISVVGITPLPIRTTQGNGLEPFTPVNVEDHVYATPAVIDGYRRSVYRRRVDLPNLNPVNM